MKNKAKCKLCESIIESFHQYDYVTCKCGEISVDGGEHYFRCAAKNWENFLRIDDEGNTIIPKIKEKEDVNPLYIEENEIPKPTRDDLIKMLDDMVKNIEDLPPDGKHSFVTQYDLACALMLIGQILKIAS